MVSGIVSFKLHILFGVSVAPLWLKESFHLTMHSFDSKALEKAKLSLSFRILKNLVSISHEPKLKDNMISLLMYFTDRFSPNQTKKSEMTHFYSTHAWELCPPLGLCSSSCMVTKLPSSISLRYPSLTEESHLAYALSYLFIPQTLKT